MKWLLRVLASLLIVVSGQMVDQGEVWFGAALFFVGLLWFAVAPSADRRHE